MTVERFHVLSGESGWLEGYFLDTSKAGDRVFYIAEVLETRPDAGGRFSVRLGGEDGETDLWVKADPDEPLYEESDGDVFVTAEWLEDHLA